LNCGILRYALCVCTFSILCNILTLCLLFCLSLPNHSESRFDDLRLQFHCLCECRNLSSTASGCTWRVVMRSEHHRTARGGGCATQVRCIRLAATESTCLLSSAHRGECVVLCTVAVRASCTCRYFMILDNDCVRVFHCVDKRNWCKYRLAKEIESIKLNILSKIR
jgi:hypothetical protein